MIAGDQMKKDEPKVIEKQRSYHFFDVGQYGNDEILNLHNVTSVLVLHNGEHHVKYHHGACMQIIAPGTWKRIDIMYPIAE